MKSNEIFLIEESRNGNINAFEELIKDYKKSAYNLALKILRNVEDAEDISQEALIKVFKNIESFNMQSSFKVWLYRIVVNSCIDFKRKKSIKAISIDESLELEESEIKFEIPDNSTNPDILIEKNFDNKLIMDAINKLDDDYKSIIILRDVEGFTYSEISEIISCNLGTVKSRLNRGRRTLKNIILNDMKLGS